MHLIREPQNYATQEAADALVTLGVTLFLAKLVDKIKVDSGKAPEKPAKTEPLKKQSKQSTADTSANVNIPGIRT